jgi:single-stranded DNA-binding protein
VDAGGKDRIVGVNCVSWARGLNEKVIARALAKGCEVLVVGAFVDTAYTARDGMERAAKELVVNRLTVLDWASDRAPDGAGEPDAERSEAQHDAAAQARPRKGRRAAA